MAKQSKGTARKRFMRIKLESVRDLILHGVIVVDYVKSVKNIVDLLTKGLSRMKFRKLRRGMGDEDRIEIIS